MSRVLVVEDEAHIRDLIVLHLGLEGLETEPVGDGHQRELSGIWRSVATRFVDVDAAEQAIGQAASRGDRHRREQDVTVHEDQPVGVRRMPGDLCTPHG